MKGADACLAITERDAAVLAPPAIVRGRARAVLASAGRNAPGTVAVAEVILVILGLEEAEVAVDGVVHARHLVFAAAGCVRALAVADGPSTKRTKTLYGGERVVDGDDDAIAGGVAGVDHVAVRVAVLVVRRRRGLTGLSGRIVVAWRADTRILIAVVGQAERIAVDVP